MESPEDDEIFFGPVSEKELRLRKQWCSRKTQLFPNSDDDKFAERNGEDQFEDKGSQENGNNKMFADIESEINPNTSLFKKECNENSELEQDVQDIKADTQLENSDSVNKQRISELPSSGHLGSDLTSLSSNLKSTADSQSQDVYLHSSEQSRAVRDSFKSQESFLMSKPTLSANDSMIDCGNDNKLVCKKLHSEEPERLSEAFEDLHLLSMPPGSDITLTPEAKFGCRKSPAKKMGTPTLSFLACGKLPDLGEEDGELQISGSRCIPPTPCNSTASSLNKNDELDCSDQRYTENSQGFVNQYETTIPSGSTSDSCNLGPSMENCTGIMPYSSTDGANASPLLGLMHHPLNDEQKYGSLESQLGKQLNLISPTTKELKTEMEDEQLDFPENDLEIITVLADENDLEIVTVLADDQSDSEEPCHTDEQIEKENQTPKSFTQSVGNTSSLKRNPIKVPEMTDHQLNMFCQLMLSPEPDHPNLSLDSPLMNALDLSTAPEKIVAPPTSSKCSLATLDLSVDDRIPVVNYINNPQLHVQKPVSIRSPLALKKEPFSKVRKTPMRLISNKLGIVNVSSHISSPSEERRDKDGISKSGKQLFTPLGSSSKSAIPVRQDYQCSAQNTSEFKKPTLAHGINIYKSKVKGSSNSRLFSSPAPCKKWNVKSPVAQYINENPVPPLMKIVRSKDEQKPVPLVEHLKEKKKGRLFCSPYTPKLIKSEGPRKGVLVPGCGLPQITKICQQDKKNPSEASETSINKTVILQRTNTLFKPLD